MTPVWDICYTDISNQICSNLFRTQPENCFKFYKTPVGILQTWFKYINH